MSQLSQYNDVLKPTNHQRMMNWWNTVGSPRKIEPAPEHIPVNPLATFWTQLTPGTTYWRCLVPARHLPGQVLHLRWSDLKEEEDGEVVMPRNVGTSIWQFVGNAARALLMAHLQERGVKALVEVDDNYTRLPPHIPGHPSDWQLKLDRTPEDKYSAEGHRKILKFCDGVIASTEVLANIYESHTTAPIYVCPNSIDLDDWHKPHKKEDGIRRIGYAGSDSHKYDLFLVERAMDYAWRQPGVELWKIGSRNIEWRYPHKEILWMQDLDEYRKSLQILDVGLCPLKRSLWHDGKSDIKAMEYLLAGAVPIVQGDSPCYKDWHGIVPTASTDKEWRKAVKWACHAPWDELKEIHSNGMDFLMKNKLIDQHIHKWHEAIQ